MASAAAVAGDDARSPISIDIGEDYGKEGEVRSGIYAKDDEAPDVNGDAEDDEEEDEDLPSNPLRGSRRPRPRNDADEDQEEEEGGGDDLFGDEEGEGEEQRPYV